jgi:hypothetical protein
MTTHTTKAPARGARVRRLAAVLAAGLLAAGGAGCRDFLDVNDNPNAPQAVSPNLYLAPMLHWMVTAPTFDGRFIGRYTQQYMLPVVGAVPSTWDRMGYDRGSDNGGEFWRAAYFMMGQNLVDMMALAQAQQRWDLLGVGQILKAWGWQNVTDANGELIIKQAFDVTRSRFDYDSQQYAYETVRVLLDSAIKNLARTDGAVDQAYLARTDRLYGGDRAKWTKLAYGMLALNLNHYTRKASYDPAAVIAAVDRSLASNADDPLLTFTGVSPDNADLNFYGRTRNNFASYRQTRFVVGLMDGTQLGAPDPRMTRMLSPSPDGVYRGLDPNVGTGGLLPAAQAPNNFYGYAGTGGLQQPGRYVFADKAKLPVMTYAQLQFVKAEAAYRQGDRATALAAYRNGISAHIDFVNDRNRDDNQSPTQISAAEKAAFLASPAIVPTSAANLTLTQIMSQKYIAQWAWGHNELWMDMRRYNYTDADPATGRQVYPGFSLPTNLFPDNGGKPVQRLRPRYNSEYVWNLDALKAIGGDKDDYHTVPLWITQP